LAELKPLGVFFCSKGANIVSLFHKKILIVIYTFFKNKGIECLRKEELRNGVV
jgi:hypothetical protein